MNQRTFAILRLLNDGQFQTDISLAKKLNCSRSTISNALKNVDSYGIVLDKIRRHGYRWINTISYLDKDVILGFPLINSNNFSIRIFETLESTNSFLLNNLEMRESNNDCIPVVATEFQTQGRGRAGRSWKSGFGDSLTFSMVWRFEQGVSALSGLSLLIGVAVVRVLNSFSIADVRLKWPNDILFDNQKLAGILIDLRGEIFGPSYAIIGIGINFKLSEIIKSSIKQRITDLSSISCLKIDRNLIFSALLIELQKLLSVFGCYGFSYFKDEWISYHVYEGKEVSLILPNGSNILGTVDGVVDDGSICLRTPVGKKSYHVGDISLRSNYH